MKVKFEFIVYRIMTLKLINAHYSIITSNLFKGQRYSMKAKNIKVIFPFKFIKILNMFPTVL